MRATIFLSVIIAAVIIGLIFWVLNKAYSRKWDEAE